MKKHKVFRLIFDFEKEEKWLNEMSAKGLHFISYNFPTYLFEEGRQGEYTYRIELLDADPSSVEGRKYIDFVEDTGVECVDTFWRWAYFRKKTSDGPFDLYTDYTSRIRHYGRIMTLTGVLVLMNAAVWIWNASIGAFKASPPLAIPGIVFTTALMKLFLSYWRRASKLKSEMHLHE